MKISPFFYTFFLRNSVSLLRLLFLTLLTTSPYLCLFSQNIDNTHLGALNEKFTLFSSLASMESAREWELPSISQLHSPAANTAQPFSPEVIGKSAFGYVTLEIEVALGQQVGITIISLDGKKEPFKITLQSTKNKIIWKSPPLPTGNYTIYYQMPPTYRPIPPQSFEIGKDRQTVIKPLISLRRRNNPI